MTTFALLTGTLVRDPEKKTSKGGRDYASASIQVRADDNRSIYWRITVFSESAIDELMRLGEGDNLSCQGAMKAELWTPEGKDPRINLSLIADSIQPLRGKPKERPASKIHTVNGTKPIRRCRAAQAANGGGRELPQLRHHGGHSPDPALDDDLPF